MAIRERMTEPDIEAQIVANSPNETDQTRYRFRFAKFAFVEDLGDRPDRPFRRALDDAANKNIAMMFAGQRHLTIQLDGYPIPSLRGDARQPRSAARIALAVWKQNAK